MCDCAEIGIWNIHSFMLLALVIVVQCVYFKSMLSSPMACQTVKSIRMHSNRLSMAWHGARKANAKQWERRGGRWGVSCSEQDFHLDFIFRFGFFSFSMLVTHTDCRYIRWWCRLPYEFIIRLYICDAKNTMIITVSILLTLHVSFYYTYRSLNDIFLACFGESTKLLEEIFTAKFHTIQCTIYG